MPTLNVRDVLRHKLLNGWPLWLLISAPISALVIYTTLRAGITTGEDVSHLIGYSVRWAVPLIYLVVATSSLHILFASPFTAWLLRNRKYFGLCFAVAMAWQGLFIFIVSTVYRDYYFSEIFYFRDELEGTIGYIFLGAMVVTSFGFARKYISAAQWKLVHKSGLYFLWAYPFSVYWWNLYYYPFLDGAADPRLLDYLFYWAGFAAFAARILAWGKQRAQRRIKSDPAAKTPVLHRGLGAVLFGLGLIGSVTGAAWQDVASTSFASIGPTGDMSLWLPFWPLEPFFPLFIIGLGVMFWTSAGTAAKRGETLTT